MSGRSIPSERPAPAVVALTGGIASGKTVASDHFARLGIPVIDTDVIARELVAPGTELLSKISGRFGEGVLLADGTLDRPALRARVFANEQDRKDLESLLHPAILETTRRRVSESTGPYVVVVVPLLAEIGRPDWVDRVLVIDVPESTQRERLMSRDGISQEQATAALAAQASRAQRRAIADDVIENLGAPSDLQQAVEVQHEKYLRHY